MIFAIASGVGCAVYEEQLLQHPAGRAYVWIKSGRYQGVYGQNGQVGPRKNRRRKMLARCR
jgi:hypothetical protein